MEFNGHHVSADGVKPLQSNVDALERIPPPVNRRQLSRFVGVATYYAKFVPSFAELCQPFRPLLKQDSEWAWSESCQQAFDNIKRKIASPPTLRHFDVMADETLVSCDASATALGACLSQKVGGVERPVAFASRVLSSAERNYSASEREALACLWACEKWHFYLYGRRFTLVTDHQALRTLLTAGGTGHRPLRLHRWCDRLYQYTFDILYRPGRENHVADCLSRSYDDTESEHSANVAAVAAAGVSDVTSSDANTHDGLIATIFGSVGTDVITLQSVGRATASDDQLSRVREYIINGWPTKKSAVPNDLHTYYAVRDELSTAMDGQCIVRGSRTVVPSALRDTVLELAHEGHPGIVRMKSRCRQAVWWPGIDKAIENFVRECTACIVSGKSVRPVPGPLLPVPLPSGPWRKLALDFAGEFTIAPAHQRYLLVAMDYYSKWPEVALCGSPTSAAAITFLTGLFDRFGLVEELVTDNGVQFTSSEFSEFLQSLGIRHSRTALYSPEAGAEAERLNRVLKEGIKAALAEGKSFQTGVRQTLAVYRTTAHAMTGVSPASLMLAFPVRTPLSVLSQFNSSGASVPHNTAVEKRVRFQQQQAAEAHDRRTRAAPTRITAGDWVRICLPRRGHKMAPTYSEPRQVARVHGNCVELCNGQRWNLRRCLHHRPSLRVPSAHANNHNQLAAQSASPVTQQSPPTALGDTTDADDDDTYITFGAAAAAVPAAAQSRQAVTLPVIPRRSGRARRPKDFSSFITN